MSWHHHLDREPAKHCLKDPARPTLGRIYQASRDARAPSDSSVI
jgi:hypothetical protein